MTYGIDKKGKTSQDFFNYMSFLPGDIHKKEKKI